MVGFVDAVKLFYKRYTDFKGRSSRSEFWWAGLYQTVVGIILGIPFFGAYMKMINDVMAGGEPSMGAIFGISSLPYILFALVNLIPNIAIVVRRFHDRNLTGWIYLGVIILMLIPLLGLLVSIGFIVFMCLRGTIGPNKYGDDPVVNGPSGSDAPFV